MTEPGAQRPAVGERLTQGTLYRRVPNTKVQWNSQKNRPTRLAFRPDIDPITQEPEPDVSMYLASLTTPEDVRHGHDGYAVCAVDITGMLAASRLKNEPISVHYDPVTPAKHPADGAHCAVVNLHGPMRKVLARSEDIVATVVPPDALIEAPSSRDADDE